MSRSCSSLDLLASLGCRAGQSRPQETNLAWAQLESSLDSGQANSNILNVRSFQVHMVKSECVLPPGHLTSTPSQKSSAEFVFWKNSTLHSTSAQSSPSHQVWKQHKTPENSGVAFGKIKAEGGERRAEVLFIWHFSSLQRPPT